jgi:gamma-glutamyl-gamma-aminobutyrate hydrolase PuuD
VSKKTETPPPSGNKVSVIQDHVLEYPELYMEVHVSEPNMMPMFSEMFARSRCTKAKSLERADLVVFTGGADVHPSLYGMDKIHKETKFNQERDARDMVTFAKCVELGIPMLGVCRGAQFLHVMNGGKLYQHVDNHLGDHSMVDFNTHAVIDRIPSTHHQMCVRNNTMNVLATAGKSTRRFFYDNSSESGQNPDIEAFYYRDTGCLGVQGHPEYRGYFAYTNWVLEQVRECIQYNPDFGWVDGNVRMLKHIVLGEKQ